jgi:hypothetical protein
LVELHDRKPARGFDARARIFGRIKLLLGFENLVVARLAFLVTRRRQLNRFAASADGLGLLAALLLVPAKRILHCTFRNYVR